MIAKRPHVVETLCTAYPNRSPVALLALRSDDLGDDRVRVAVNRSQ